MGVHSGTRPALGSSMHIEALARGLPYRSGGADKVADLVETFHAGDGTATVSEPARLRVAMRTLAKGPRLRTGGGPGWQGGGPFRTAGRRGVRS